jgi:hypothetical protein
VWPCSESAACPRLNQDGEFSVGRKEDIHDCAARLSESSCAQMSWSATGPFQRPFFAVLLVRRFAQMDAAPIESRDVDVRACHAVVSSSRSLFLAYACWFSAFEYNQPAHTHLIPNHLARSIHLYRASDTTQSQTRHEKIERCAQPHSPLMANMSRQPFVTTARCQSSPQTAADSPPGACDIPFS